MLALAVAAWHFRLSSRPPQAEAGGQFHGRFMFWGTGIHCSSICGKGLEQKASLKLVMVSWAIAFSFSGLKKISSQFSKTVLSSFELCIKLNMIGQDLLQDCFEALIHNEN